ncbi:MAG: CotH kinase family protein [Verrucomicrobiota bacterium]
MQHSRPPLSPARRRARWLVWGAFAAVLALRWAVPPEQPEPHAWPGEDSRRGERRRARLEPAPPTAPPTAPPARTLPTNLWRIQITLSPEDADRLRGDYWHRGRPPGQPRTEVRARVEEGGTTYANVALHLKGSAGSFRPFDDQPAFTLHFSKHASGQRFHGMAKLSLNNSVQDPSFLCEAISRELFVAAGVPTPAATHATVVVNGRDLGLYVAVEGWGKPFLRRHFPRVDGHLYDSGFVQDIHAPLEVTSGDAPDDRADLDALLDAAREPDRARRWERLEAVLDMDRFLTLLALEVMLCHWDGYAMNRNNYRVFQDRSTGKMVFLPHGLDQLLGGRRVGTDLPILPPLQGIVARSVLSTATGRKRYLARLQELLDTHFQVPALHRRAQELADRIRPTLAAYSPDAARFHDAMVESLKFRIQERGRELARQLAEPRDALAVPAGQFVRVEGWAPRVFAGRPAPVRHTRVEHEGRRALGLGLPAAGGGGSWRTRVRLDPGRYWFVGEARSEGLAGGAGVGLRVAGTTGRYQPAETGWVPLRVGLEIDEEGTEVELLCEAGGSGGQAWFAEETLGLVRER